MNTSNPTLITRKSERELVVTRAFKASVKTVFDAWTTPSLFMRWWAPKSMGVPLLSCDMDVRVGGKYRLAFGQDEASSFAFFGKYVDVKPNSRLAWTNEENTDGALTTVTFEEKDGQTLLALHELYPSKEELDNACAGVEGAMPEQFAQLDALLASLG